MSNPVAEAGSKLTARNTVYTSGFVKPPEQFSNTTFPPACFVLTSSKASLTSSNSGNAVTDDSYWEKQSIPAQFGPYLIKMCLAEMAKAAGEYQLYGISKGEARSLLDDEIFIIDEQERQKKRTQFVNHSTAQSRNTSTN